MDFCAGVMKCPHDVRILACGVAVFAVTSLASAAFFAAPARAGEEPQSVSSHAIATANLTDPAQSTIIRQLYALRNRDAREAFSLTTKALHKKFENPEKFINAMRFEYRPLYNNDKYTFLEKQVTDTGIQQNVEIEDKYEGKATVIFRLKPQENGQWLIDSFMVLDSDAQPI